MKKEKHAGGRPPGPLMPCGWGCGDNLTVVQMRTHFRDCINRPPEAGRIQFENDGWVYYDQWGRDFGPYESRDAAWKQGLEASRKEERTLARR